MFLELTHQEELLKVLESQVIWIKTMTFIHVLCFMYTAILRCCLLCSLFTSSILKRLEIKQRLQCYRNFVNSYFINNRTTYRMQKVRGFAISWKLSAHFEFHTWDRGRKRMEKLEVSKTNSWRNNSQLIRSLGSWSVAFLGIKRGSYSVIVFLRSKNRQRISNEYLIIISK